MTTSSPHAHLWNLDESMLYLNHGSFGAATVATRERKQAIQDQIESQPGRFFLRELFGLMVEAREAIGSLVGAAGMAGYLLVARRYPDRLSRPRLPR